MDTKEKKSGAFSEITNSGALIEYLQSGDRRDNINFLHHYTSIDVVVKIIRDGFWHLGKAIYMNDKLEYESGSHKIWDHIFFSSFMGEDKESIAMWSMYGQPWEKGVKISIPKNSANKWIKEVDAIHEIDMADYTRTGEKYIIEKNALRITAVAYSNCHDTEDESEEVLRWSTVANKALRINPSDTGELTGYIKNKAWSYEKEFRIMLNEKSCSSFQRAAIEVPEYIVDELVITPSPLFDGDFIQELHKTVQREVKIIDSLFLDKLNIRSVCSGCEYRAMLR